MYICLDCGKALQDDNIIHTSEWGEYWGNAYSYTRKCCPYCQGNISEADFCENCGVVVLNEDLTITQNGQQCWSCVMAEEEECQDG